MYYGGLQNYKGLIFLTQGEQVTIIVYAYAGITRFLMKKALHPNLQNQTSQKSTKTISKKQSGWEHFPWSPWKALLGEKNSLLWKTSRGQVFFSPLRVRWGSTFLSDPLVLELFFFTETYDDAKQERAVAQTHVSHPAYGQQTHGLFCWRCFSHWSWRDVWQKALF